jgi:hypothetical protein
MFDSNLSVAPIEPLQPLEFASGPLRNVLFPLNAGPRSAYLTASSLSTIVLAGACARISGRSGLPSGLLLWAPRPPPLHSQLLLFSFRPSASLMARGFLLCHQGPSLEAFLGPLRSLGHLCPLLPPSFDPRVLLGVSSVLFLPSSRHSPSSKHLLFLLLLPALRARSSSAPGLVSAVPSPEQPPRPPSPSCVLQLLVLQRQVPRCPPWLTLCSPKHLHRRFHSQFGSFLDLIVLLLLSEALYLILLGRPPVLAVALFKKYYRNLPGAVLYRLLIPIGA